MRRRETANVRNAIDAMDITQELKLHLNKEHAWQIQPCSALTGAGLMEGMDWVAHTVRNQRSWGGQR